MLVPLSYSSTPRFTPGLTLFDPTHPAIESQTALLSEHSLWSFLLPSQAMSRPLPIAPAQTAFPKWSPDASSARIDPHKPTSCPSVPRHLPPTQSPKNGASVTIIHNNRSFEAGETDTLPSVTLGGDVVGSPIVTPILDPIGLDLESNPPLTNVLTPISLQNPLDSPLSPLKSPLPVNLPPLPQLNLPPQLHLAPQSPPSPSQFSDSSAQDPLLSENDGLRSRRYGGDDSFVSTHTPNWAADDEDETNRSGCGCCFK